MGNLQPELILLILILLGILIYLLIKIFKKVARPPLELEAPIISHLKNKLSIVDPKIVTFDIRENSSESYTNNKDTMYICTIDPKTKEYYSDNTLIYVILHEWAHVLDPNHDPSHDGDTFKMIFSTLLTRAKNLGIYNDKIPLPKTYCSV